MLGTRSKEMPGLVVEIDCKKLQQQKELENPIVC